MPTIIDIRGYAIYFNIQAYQYFDILYYISYVVSCRVVSVYMVKIYLGLKPAHQEIKNKN